LSTRTTIDEDQGQSFLPALLQQSLGQTANVRITIDNVKYQTGLLRP
jgi:hypothetical protein